MSIEIDEGYMRFKHELLTNGDFCNPFGRELDGNRWLGFERAKYSWEQQEILNDFREEFSYECFM